MRRRVEELKVRMFTDFRLSLLAVSFFLVFASGNASAQGWRGIVPLKSTRADVERLLGKPSENPPIYIYYLEDNTVTFEYSTCGCGPQCKEGWDVPIDTVLLISVGVKGQVKFEETKMDLSNFKRVRGNYDIPDHFYYVNENDGVTYEVGQGYLVSYIYRPPRKDYDKRCNKTGKGNGM